MFQIGTCICFPYPTRQVSKSWHTLDGVLPKTTICEGRAKSHTYTIAEQWFPVTDSSAETSLKVTMPAYNLSLEQC